MHTIGVLDVCRRAKEQTIDDAEHGGVGADTEPERRDDSGGECRSHAQPAYRVFRVLRYRGPPRGAFVRAESLPVKMGHALFSTAAVTKPAIRLGARLLGRHALRDEFA